jgi:uncharacterized membrane protein YeaQ/YmgE (transglycosylase-associated protein family)
VTLGELVALVIVAAICGAIGARIAGRSSIGCLGSIALGFIGGALGSWIARKLDLPILLELPFAPAFPVIWSIMGSALFVAVLGLLSSGRSERN